MARLIESSLWVNFTRRKSPAELKARIQPWILDPAAALCEPVVFEVLRHATPGERQPIQAQFDTLPCLDTPTDLWSAAATLGQQCRDQGVTPGSLDLLIAALALRHDAEIVTFDSDYRDIARVVPLHVRLLHSGEPDPISEPRP
jgi:predicted nucleic acid-binding protein